ncbi:unnamed protein product [Brassica oleracea var. botrytis]
MWRSVVRLSPPIDPQPPSSLLLQKTQKHQIHTALRSSTSTQMLGHSPHPSLFHAGCVSSTSFSEKLSEILFRRNSPSSRFFSLSF